MTNKNFSQTIITFALLYSAILCHFEAMDKFQDEETMISIVLWICSFVSLMGALRFRIAKIVNFLRKKDE